MDLKLLQEELKKSNPLMNLPEKERLWLIDYAKLRTCFYKYYDQLQFSKKFDFPDPAHFEDRYTLAAWKLRSHPVNEILNIIKMELNEIGVDWWKEQNYKVNYIVCDRHPSEGCTGCKSFNDCKLRCE